VSPLFPPSHRETITSIPNPRGPSTNVHTCSPPLGATSGFGLATTRLFVAEGCKVVACDLNGDGLSKQFSSLDTAHHIATVTGSVTDASVWKTLVSTAKEKFGGLDIVINNAGTSYRNKPTVEVTEADFDRCFSVNVKSVFLSIPACVPALEERGGGAIINVASIGAIRPRPGLVWYNASKGAVANVSVSSLLGKR
jgi:NAD(P)-dependent dehydrogenase (short-subunit alcohol dehydrogenase family)